MIIERLVYAFIVILIGYFVFRIIVRRDYRRNKKLSSISYTLELIVFLVHANMIYLVLPVRWPNWPPAPENPLIKYASILLMVLGFCILSLAWINLGTKRSFGQDKKILQTRGIYHFSRNPQLLGYGILLMGFALMVPSWYSLGWFALYLAIAWLMIRTEEEFLLALYGNLYSDYCDRVPRIIRI